MFYLFFPNYVTIIKMNPYIRVYPNKSRGEDIKQGKIIRKLFNSNAGEHSLRAITTL